MSLKLLIVSLILSLGVTWIYIPWNEVETNGTGDNIRTYNSKGFAIVIQPPLSVISTREFSGKALIEPDRQLLLVEDLSVMAFWTVVYFFSNCRKGRDPSLPNSIKSTDTPDEQTSP